MAKGPLSTGTWASVQSLVARFLSTRGKNGVPGPLQQGGTAGPSRAPWLDARPRVQESPVPPSRGRLHPTVTPCQRAAVLPDRGQAQEAERRKGGRTPAGCRRCH